MIPPVNSGGCGSRASPPWGERQPRPSGVRSVKSQSCLPLSRGHNWTPAGAWCPQLGARNPGPGKGRNNSSLELGQTGSPEEEGAGLGGGEGAGARAEKNLANGSGCCRKPPAQFPGPWAQLERAACGPGWPASLLCFPWLGRGCPSRCCCCCCCCCCSCCCCWSSGALSRGGGLCKQEVRVGVAAELPGSPGTSGRRGTGSAALRLPVAPGRQE
ncbi:LOW QUALITY PROTEIN: uncharacterized protein LOC116423030 [Sarcophilus harrisii]|uniref:LOW QUALITY PROTEIN: uncharacterized protein LOC116423030 n=1 Tax=Sarcophilus harrisii TaxID=9305 RepID=UPI001301A569|nr:LOW QUALITY PROTEIN: uncharacterized protein LOC116423030 [Sarcophilus harrisii]